MEVSPENDPSGEYKHYLLAFSRALDEDAQNDITMTRMGCVGLHDLDARFVMADSVIESFHNGNTSNSVVCMLQWASDMVQLLRDIEDAYRSRIPFAQVRDILN